MLYIPQRVNIVCARCGWINILTTYGFQHVGALLGDPPSPALARLAGWPFPQVFPAAVMHLGTLSAFLSTKKFFSWWKPSYWRQKKQTTLRECVLVLLSFPEFHPGYSLPLETLADHHHWALQNTKNHSPFHSVSESSEGKSLEAPEGSEHHGRKSQLFLSIKKSDISFFLFLLKSELGCHQRGFCALMTPLWVGEAWYSFAASEENLLGACRDCHAQLVFLTQSN